MNHAAHASNMLRTAAQKKKQLPGGSRNTAHVTVTSNYEKFAQQFAREHALKSQPTAEQSSVQQPRRHYRTVSNKLPEVDDPEAEQLWDDEGLSEEHRNRARLAYERWLRKNSRIQPKETSANGPTPKKGSKKGNSGTSTKPTNQQERTNQNSKLTVPGPNQQVKRIKGKTLASSESTTTLLLPDNDNLSRSIAASAAIAVEKTAVSPRKVTIVTIEDNKQGKADILTKEVKSAVNRENHTSIDVINEGTHRRRPKPRQKLEMPTAKGASAANRGAILDDDAYDVTPARATPRRSLSSAESDGQDAIALSPLKNRKLDRADLGNGIEVAPEPENGRMKSRNNRSSASASSSSSYSSRTSSGSAYDSDCSASDVENQHPTERAMSASPSKKAAAAAALYERQNASANVVLYVGLGMVSIGLIITFVGVGEKGFSASELKMVGPSLIGAGVFFCFLRVFFCTCPHCCRKHCGCQFPCCIQRGGGQDGENGDGGDEAEEDGVLKVAARPSAHTNDFATRNVTGGTAGPSTSRAHQQQPPSSSGAGSRSNPSARPRTSQQHAAATIAAALEEGTVDLSAVVTDDPGNRSRARRSATSRRRTTTDDDNLEDLLSEESPEAMPSAPPPDYFAGVPKFPAIPTPSASGSQVNIAEVANRGSNFSDMAGGGSSSSFHSATPDVEAVAIAPLSPPMPTSGTNTASKSGVVLSASALA